MDNILSNCKILNNDFSGIGLFNSKVTVNGNLTITNNTAINGGGMLLCESSYIILRNDTHISFVNNHAIQSGGGLYIEDTCIQNKPILLLPARLQ